MKSKRDEHKQEVEIVYDSRSKSIWQKEALLYWEYNILQNLQCLIEKMIFYLCQTLTWTHNFNFEWRYTLQMTYLEFNWFIG